MITDTKNDVTINGETGMDVPRIHNADAAGKKANWPVDEIDENANRYIDFSLTAPTTAEVRITKISMFLGAYSTGFMKCHVNTGFGADFTDVRTIYEVAQTALPNKSMNYVELTPAITIPAGVADGMSMRIEGKGYAGYNGGPNGDLYIHVRVKKHEDFVREGDDIYLEIPISVTQAVLGDNIEVPTVYGNVSLKIPAGTQPNTKFRLKGKGAKNVRSRINGDQYVTVKVEIPTSLSSEEKSIFEQLKKTEGNKGESAWEKFKKKFKK